MKFRLLALGAALAALCSGALFSSFAEAPPIIRHNNSPWHLQAPAIKENETLFVPARQAFELVGLETTWHAAANIVTGSKGSFTIKIMPNNAAIDRNGFSIHLKHAPKMMNGAFYVPMEFLTDVLNLEVSRNNATGVVDIYSNRLNDTLTFKDPGLNSRIRSALSVPTDKRLTLLDVLYVTELDISRGNVWGLEGIEKFANLKSLNAEGNYIPRVDGLADLEYLENLNLSNNNVKSIAPLSTLENLKTLDLRNNNIGDIRGISTLYRLEQLFLVGNKISTAAAKSPLYYRKAGLTVDISLEEVEEPLRDTWNLRADADPYRIEVFPNVFWRPASAFGTTRMDNDALTPVTGNTADGKSTQIHTLYELLQIAQHTQVTVSPNDKTVTDSAARITWHYPEAPASVLNDFSGSPKALAQAFANTLSQDYEESGYLVFVYPDNSQKLMNYIKTQRTVTVQAEDDDEEDEIINRPEYAVFDVMSYRNGSPSPAVPEDGLLSTYTHGSKLNSNIHASESMNSLIAPMMSEKQPVLVYKVRFSGNVHSTFPTGTFTPGKAGAWNYIVFPKTEDEDETPIQNNYEVLYDNPHDLTAVIYAVNTTEYPAE